jgi:hypothetical protein
MLSRYGLLIALIITCLAGCAGHAVSPNPTPELPQLESMPAPAGVDAQLWPQLTRELSRVLNIAGTGRSGSAAPLDNNSQVLDLSVSPGTGNAAVFSWGYRCTGDYDQNGEVNIADLTPIGLYFGLTSAAPNWTAARLADGDGNGEVNIADITPVGLNFGVRVGGYQLESGDSASGPWTQAADILLATVQQPGDGGYNFFAYTLDAPPDPSYFRVLPFDASGAARELGIASDAVYFSSDMLPAPLNLQASDGTYSNRVYVSWDKVAGATQYMVYRDSQVSPLATLGDVGSYDDTAVADTAPHTYWVKATDGVLLSNFSTPDSGYLSSIPAPLDPPANVRATDGDYLDHIFLNWSKALNASGYRVYRDSQAAPVAEVGDVAYYNDYAPTDTFQHTYWVQAFDATDESLLSSSDTGYIGDAPTGTMTVLAWNDLGMHCMNQDFSEMMILPPYNVLHAQVISKVGGEPQIVTGGISIHYTIPENTHSADKCNFWDYAHALLGANLTPDIGLTGNGMAGTMSSLLPDGRQDWSVTGIPITPINDAGEEDAYNLATVIVEAAGQQTARTQAVVPVSWEISCDLCHYSSSHSVATDILMKHDALHSTNLMNAKPVLCGGCHAQPPLGTTGITGLPTLSSAMHSAHASRMAAAGLEVECYACHPGQRTQCLRDVMYAQGLSCHDCHGTMTDVGNSARSPWTDEPRCGDCHNVAGHEYEQTGVLYRNSVGHNGIMCAACHGSPHAITPTVQSDDNIQAITLQGHSGTIDTCTVCHTTPPGDPFNHTIGEGGGD